MAKNTASSSLRVISTPNAPQPLGPYSQGIVYGKTLYVSGQLPIDPKTGEKRLGTIEEQARQTLENIKAIVVAAGSDLTRVTKVTVYISDLSLGGRFNAVYAEFFGDHRPARAVVPSKELHFGFLLEIDAVAACD